MVEEDEFFDWSRVHLPVLAEQQGGLSGPSGCLAAFRPNTSASYSLLRMIEFVIGMTRNLYAPKRRTISGRPAGSSTAPTRQLAAYRAAGAGYARPMRANPSVMTRPNHSSSS